MAAYPISYSFSHFVLAISFFVICLSSISSTDAQNGGFSLELIYRDSLKSPLFNPSETRFERITNSLRRFFNHAKLIDSIFASPSSAQADIIPNEVEYHMKIAIGTPPVEILAVADTGSDLIWTQCQPCFLFIHLLNVPCLFSKQCASMKGTPCFFLGGGNCVYSVSYGDKSYSNGNLAIDTITLGSVSGRPVVLPKTIIALKLLEYLALEGGNVSLVSQMGPSLGGKFSYCMVPLSLLEAAKSTKINFGTNGVVSCSGVISTPLVARNSKTFYFLTLEAISVGNQRIEVLDSSSSGTKEGNAIIDSVSVVSSLINAAAIKDPNGLLDLCYNFSSDFNIPEITVHLLVHMVSKELVCLIFKGFDQGLAIYGKLMQMNFLVGYDTEKRTVSFKQTDCTNR
ncbi:peptidase A1 domain-containing protein [Citrus sinensis]|nr:peptidase A1 domain-containing protein [Citrus sinensis]